MDCSLTRLLRPWDFPGKSTGVGCHFLFQGIFPTQGLNPGLPHWRQTLYHLSHQGSQSYLWVISNPKRWCCQNVALTMPANLENSAVATGLEKVSFHSNHKERQRQRCSNYCTIALISHASKLMLNILQARLQQSMNWGLPDVQLGYRKGRGTRDQIANIHWIIEKAKEFQKYTYPATLTTPKPLTVWITTNCGKYLKRWEDQITLSASWETWM